MDKRKKHDEIGHGQAMWHASRLKPIVKKLGSKNIKKPKQEKK